jgi:UDP-N-acetylglucosamine/UDP-N-acetylgalactosamine diphosphorylase
MKIVNQLVAHGVIIPAPGSVYVDANVKPEKIARGVTIHPGCRLSGAELSIGPASVIGREAPATVSNCQLGTGVELAGGFFENSTFLDGFKAGSGAHIRPGCLFEEGSSIAHCVGVKQTVLMPWVIAGSLINLCDCLVAGGTGRTDHSEIGSSYIHFNFTPQHDKATASLIGDVPHGVMLNQPPIFLGGQGGLVGPCVIAYGTVIPAGQIWRGDIREPGRLTAKGSIRGNLSLPYDTRVYRGVSRILANNLYYIGNIMALDLWYRVFRSRFMLGDTFQAACHAGARQRLSQILTERIMRLSELADKVRLSLSLQKGEDAVLEQQVFVDQWPEAKTILESRINARENAPVPGAIAACINKLPRDNYLKAIQSLDRTVAGQLTGWLESFARESFAGLNLTPQR